MNYEMTNDEIAEMIAERNGNQHFCKNCDDCCQPYDSTDDCFKSAMQMAEWKDRQSAQEKQQLINKLQKWLNENPPIKNKSVNEFYVNSLLKAMKGE